MSSEAINEDSIRKLVDVFYERVREDVVLGPVFESRLAGKWDVHLPRSMPFGIRCYLESATSKAMFLAYVWRHRASRRSTSFGGLRFSGGLQ